jgi:uncharacterized protein (DUF885 family)
MKTSKPKSKKPAAKSKAAPAASPSAALAAVAVEAWEFQMREAPTWGTFLGDRRYDHLLEERGAAARARRRKALAALLRKVDAIPSKSLAGEDAITHAVLRRNLSEQQEGLGLHGWEWDLNQLSGIHVELQDLLAFHVLDSEKSVRDLVSRYEAVPAAFEQWTRDLRDGIKSGRTAPKVAFDRVVPQLDAFLAQKPADSPFGRPSRNLPKKLKASVKAALAKDLDRAAAGRVFPAYAAFRDFLKKEYAGHERAVPGVHSIPGGRDYYAWRVRTETTTDLSPEEIHAIGIEELATNKREMLAIGRKGGHRGDLRSYLDELRDDRAGRCGTREKLVDRYTAIMEKMQAALPKAFRTLPRTTCRVEAMPGYKENDAPAAYYYPPADDGSRPGIFFANTRDPETWPAYEMETLTFHEAVPGHHLQIALAQEQRGLPAVRRHAQHTAYVEGWAQYAERLADEMGCFTADADRVGMLAGQAWRAARLVVDTGLHHFGWDRKRAVDLLLEIKTGPESDVHNEVDRYIVWPGQALAYKVGQLEILRLRDDARARLNARFDIKAFHDVVLGSGAVSLPVLRSLVGGWLESATA